MLVKVCLNTGPCVGQGVLKHRTLCWSRGEVGTPFCQKNNFFTMDFCLCGAILKFPEHVFPTACVGLPGLTPSGPRARGLITYLVQDLICPKSDTALSPL